MEGELPTGLHERTLYNTTYLEAYTNASEDEITIQKGFNEVFVDSLEKGIEVGAELGRLVAEGDTAMVPTKFRIKEGLREIVDEANGTRKEEEEVEVDLDWGDDGDDWLMDDDDESNTVGASIPTATELKVPKLHPSDRLYNDVIKTDGSI